MINLNRNKSLTYMENWIHTCEYLINQEKTYLNSAKDSFEAKLFEDSINIMTEELEIRKLILAEQELLYFILNHEEIYHIKEQAITGLINNKEMNPDTLKIFRKVIQR